MAFGVYVHFPYCRTRCPYCDFAIHVRRRIPHEAYAEAVAAELAVRATLFPGRALASIYFGGGTPSLWEPACIARVIASVRARFTPSGGACDAQPIEITVEANPDDLPREVLDGLRAAGVNRLSVGAQSFDPARLQALGRLHGPDEIRRAAHEASAAGFDNLSFDLIFGMPDQTLAELSRDLDQLLALDSDHLSIYQLTVEPFTPFDAYRRRGTLPLPDPERAAELSELIEARLRGAGYAHYEVSSWARKGRRAVHNALYWSGGEWLGLGCSSHSFRLDGSGGGARWSTVKNVDAYMRGANADGATEADQKLNERSLKLNERSLSSLADLIAGEERIDRETLAREAIWLGLRLLDDGINRAHFAVRFGTDPVERFAREIAPLVAGDLLAVSDSHMRLTPRGALLADEVALRFL